MYQNVTQLSAELNRFGIGRGDRVAIVMGNGPEMLISSLAVTMCSVALPLNPKYKKGEFSFYYDDTRPCALITLEGCVPLAHEAATEDMKIIQASPMPDGTLSFRLTKGKKDQRSNERAVAEDIAMILHTSGTTNRPKPVPLRHSNLVASAMNIKATYQLTPSDRSLCIMPLFHIHGIVGSALSRFASGGTFRFVLKGFI